VLPPGPDHAPDTIPKNESLDPVSVVVAQCSLKRYWPRRRTKGSQVLLRGWLNTTFFMSGDQYSQPAIPHVPAIAFTTIQNIFAVNICLYINDLQTSY
jgi:hypothetical protein